MKPFKDYKAQRQGGAREILPAGGYIATIMNAEEQKYSWGSVLLISFDISEGDLKGFFKKDYADNTSENRKWRGTYRLSLPKDDGSEKDGWTKNTFNGAMWAIEESNKGYSWDWNEAGLKGKTVGVLFRDKEWEIEGKSGWTTECCKLDPASDIREGKFKMPKAKPLTGTQAATAAGFTDITANDSTDKLPWETDGKPIGDDVPF